MQSQIMSLSQKLQCYDQNMSQNVSYVRRYYETRDKLNLTEEILESTLGEK